jgi:hypothetical protein
MSSQIKYVAYLSESDSGSALFRSHYEKLPPHHKAEIKILDFHQIKKHYGANCPPWLKGFPVVATYSSQPTIWEGSKAIELVASWAQQSAPAQQQAAPPMPPGGGGGPARGGGGAPAPAAGGVAPVEEFQPMGGGGFGTCAVVSDDLYQSHMPNKGGSIGRVSNGKVSAADISQYTQQRGARQPAHRAGVGHMPM